MDEIISALPDAPGCYIFWDNAGDCLYVGKSKRVKSRVKSYFGKHNPPKVQKLAKLIARIEYRPAVDEIDALYLEHSLIKTYRPPFNSQMKKDRHLHYICIEWEQALPGLYISDKPESGATRYGGFNSVYDAKEALTQINRAWATPVCEKKYYGKPQHSCLNLHIHRCLGPCQKENQKNYREGLLKAASFMQGRNKKALSQLKQEMQKAALNYDFEKAARLRDILNELQYLQKRFAYRVPFYGRRLCVFIKGYNELGFLLLHFINGQLKQAVKCKNLEDWPLKRDIFVKGDYTDTAEEAKLYTATATQEIRARKCYIDITKARKESIAKRLDKIAKRIYKGEH